MSSFPSCKRHGRSQEHTRPPSAYAPHFSAGRPLRNLPPARPRPLLPPTRLFPDPSYRFLPRGPPPAPKSTGGNRSHVHGGRRLSPGEPEATLSLRQLFKLPDALSPTRPTGKTEMCTLENRRCRAGSPGVLPFPPPAGPAQGGCSLRAPPHPARPSPARRGRGGQPGAPLTARSAPEPRAAAPAAERLPPRKRGGGGRRGEGSYLPHVRSAEGS